MTLLCYYRHTVVTAITLWFLSVSGSIKTHTYSVSKFSLDLFLYVWQLFFSLINYKKKKKLFFKVPHVSLKFFGSLGAIILNL